MKAPLDCLCCLLVLASAICPSAAWQPSNSPHQVSRRAWWQQTLTGMAVVGVPASWLSSSGPAQALVTHDLNFITTPSGLQYADAKVGSGPPLTTPGSPLAIDYVMSTTGARYGSKIYSSKESGAPYRWKLGDGSTISGLEQAIAGGAGVEPMRPGGVRRVIIPAALAYQSLAQPLDGLQYQNCQDGYGVGPIPPKGEGAVAEYYQRFKNIYCNANRPYQPDLVMDVKLYGPRS